MSDKPVLSETLRYLGVRDAVADEELLTLARRAIDRVELAADKRCCVQRVSCAVTEGTVVLGSHSIVSVQLANHLQGCDEAFLFAATLGAGVDRLLRRDTVSHPSLAVAEQAAAAAVIEQYCDDVCARLQSSLDGWYCRSRFSAGYGDVPLSEQPFFLRVLDASKRIGLNCTDSYMLVPTKSVTAVIGIAKHPSRCYAADCACCSKTDCAFRKYE